MTKTPKSSGYPLTDEFVWYTEAFAGFLTKIKTEFGGVSAMLEHHEWNESKTPYCAAMISGLLQHLGKLQKEMTDHESGKH